MVKKIIKQILNEVFELDQEKKKELRDKFKLQTKYTQKGKGVKGKPFSKRIIQKFRTEKYIYFIYIDKFDYNLYVISFFPKLSEEWESKQKKLQQQGKEYHTVFSYQTKENIPLQIFGLLMTTMSDMIEQDPTISFGYLGSPTIHTTDKESDWFNTKRMKIYNEMLKRNFSSTHEVKSILDYSGGLVLNKEMLETYPNLREYSIKVLRSHM